VGHGSYHYDLTRDAVMSQVTGNTHGNGTDFNLGLAYDAWRTNGFSVAPYLSLDHTRFDVDGFTEQGASDHRLVLDGYATTRTTATVGSTFFWQKEVAGRPTQLSVDAALQGVLQEGNHSVDARFGADPSVQFPLAFESRKRVVPLLGFAGTMVLGKGLTASVSLDAALSDRRDDSLKLRVAKEF
jgi:outer membrane autotransporter protein